MNTRTYTSITLDKAQQLLKVAQDNGLAVQGDNHTGTLSGYGVEVNYTYTESAQTLVLGVARKPFVISNDFVFGEIEQYTGLK